MQPKTTAFIGYTINLGIQILVFIYMGWAIITLNYFHIVLIIVLTIIQNVFTTKSTKFVNFLKWINIGSFYKKF